MLWRQLDSHDSRLSVNLETHIYFESQCGGLEGELKALQVWDCGFRRIVIFSPNLGVAVCVFHSR